MHLSIVVLARNLRAEAVECVRSIHASVARLRLDAAVEYVLVDDASEPGAEVAPAYADLRPALRGPVKILRMTARQHYTRSVAAALAAADPAASVLFVSHDMVVTPAYLRTLLAVAALDPAFGVVRGTSTYVDCFPNHVVKPPLPPRSAEDVFAFAEHVAAYHGLAWVEDGLLTGDSMLIRPAALAAVGGFDPRYPGYFGDVDFGLRVQRAGLKMVCAKGAWLLHEGAGYYRRETAQTAGDGARVHEDRMKAVQAAYAVFRDKWDPAMPPDYAGVAALPLEKLRAGPAPAGGDFLPRVLPDPAVCQLL